MLVVVKRLITVLAAAAVLGVVSPAAARVPEPAFDATLTARLERSWTWQLPPHACGPAGGRGLRVLTIRTSTPVPVGRGGGTLAVVGTLELQGRAQTWESAAGGRCVETARLCAVRRTPLAGSVRLSFRGGVLRLAKLRYRTSGRTGCAPDAPAVGAALRGEPRLESVPVRDRGKKLANARIPRISAQGRFDPSTRLSGDVEGEVRVAVRWSLNLTRR